MSLVFNKYNKDAEVMDFVDILGYKIRYICLNKLSSNKTLVLLHGIGASAERWSFLWPLLKDYNVIIPDIIGFGYSDKPLIEYRIEFFVNFLKEFFNKLNISNPVVVASSFGGLLAIEFALKNKDFFDKMILLSPAGTMDRPTYAFSQYIFAGLYPIEENVRNAFKLMSNSDADFIDPSIINDFINRMKLPNAKYALISTLLAMRNNKSIKYRLSEITTPTLVIWGSNDRTIPTENINYFKNLPMVETKIIENCGHNPHVEKPIECYQIIEKFIES